MALVKDVNSYVTVAEADAYFLDRLDSSGWAGSQKDLALIAATRLIDLQSWSGVVESDTQTLAFPRSGVYFDPRRGINVEYDGVPKEVLDATCEQALTLLMKDPASEDGAAFTRIEEITVDVITIKGSLLSESANALSGSVFGMLKKFRYNARRGGPIWFRAN